jgi:hypothetical protein
MEGVCGDISMMIIILIITVYLSLYHVKLWNCRERRGKGRKRERNKTKNVIGVT